MRSLVHALRSRAARSRRVRALFHKAPAPSVAETVQATQARDIIAHSGLFDDAWYHERYPDLPPDMDAATHYLEYGAVEGRHPSPRFDSAWYLSANPDVQAANTNPLVHYVLFGFDEGRPIRALNSDSIDPDRIPLGLLSVHQQNTPLPGSIAVVVHAFYPDVFDEICAMLPHIPGPFGLYVSVPSADGQRQAQASVAKHRVMADVTIEVCVNRGRNFAPFVAQFGPRVARHDIVLHLHTKKSLYTGAEQETWRKHLYHTLIGTSELVQMTLDQFAKGPTLGVVYPSTAASIPYWAHHWLSNGHLAPGLFERLGIPRPQTRGYIDYPVGGMFWARVDAIRPLLTAGFTYEDFPPEHGQTDGTLAHAIERSIVALAQNRGYDFLEVDVAQGVARRNRGAKNLDQYAAQSFAQLAARINAETVDLVSFDIFDTLLLRPSRTPDAVLRYVGRVVLKSYPTAHGFFERRKQAETAARAAKQFAGDVDIDEIYAHFPNSDDWSDEAIEHVHRLELLSELRISQPRRAGVEAVRVAREAGKRIIAISDTYLKRSFVERLLAAAGVEPLDELYISSERQARKDHGDLWQLVMQSERVTPGRWLHIGDNEHSDVQLPSDRGIGIFHVMNPTTLFEERGFSRTAPATAARWGTDLALGPLVNQIGGDPFLPQHAWDAIHLDTPWEVGHAVFGPILFAFTSWIATHPTTRHLNHLYFLSREGFTLRRCYEMVRTYCDDLDLPQSSYFLTSRRMAMSAAQGRGYSPDMILGDMHYNGTLASLLSSRLGLHVPQHLAADAIPLNLPDDEALARDTLDVLRGVITAHGQRELDLYLRYCAEMGIDGPEPCGIVDVGYSGTIQRSLQTVLGKPLVGYYMATFDAATAASHGGGYAYGCFSEDREAWTSKKPIVQHSLFMEAFLSAPDGQLNGFNDAQGSVQPVFKSDQRSAHLLSALAEMQAGALAYCEALLQAYGSSLIGVPLDLALVQEPLQLLYQGKIKVPTEVAQTLLVEDDFTGAGDLAVGSALATIARR